jgi:hypothetical protein
MHHNKSMNENELTILVKNEIEWRKKLWQKLETVESNQVESDKTLTGLKIKVSLFGGFFGAIGGALITYLSKPH